MIVVGLEDLKEPVLIMYYIIYDFKITNKGTERKQTETKLVHSYILHFYSLYYI